MRASLTSTKVLTRPVQFNLSFTNVAHASTFNHSIQYPEYSRLDETVKNYMTGINKSGTKGAYGGGSHAIWPTFIIAAILLDRNPISTFTRGLGGSHMIYRDGNDEQERL
jgi:hypothetical protein